MSSIYKTGAISVNNGSNIVTGNGTSFLGVAGTLAGDLFSVDGVNFYEIYQVDSNNQIRIRTIPAGLPFQQSSKSNSDYAILRNFTSSTSAEVAARVVAVQQKWHLREEEMTGWFASTDNYYNVTSINGDIISVITPAGIANLLGTAATRDVGTSAGNVMEVGAFGLGGTGKFISLTDWHQLGEYETGFYTSFQSAQNSVNNSPPITTSNTNYTIFVQRDGVRVKITAYVSKGVQAFTKTYTGSAWTDWFENYDSGNTNFNEYHGGIVNEVFATGVMASNSVARIFFPLNATSAPISLTLETGGFKVLGGVNGYLAESTTQLSLSGWSSKKMAVVEITGLSGTKGEFVTIQAAAASSGITFNF